MISITDSLRISLYERKLIDGAMSRLSMRNSLKMKPFTFILLILCKFGQTLVHMLIFAELLTDSDFALLQLSTAATAAQFEAVALHHAYVSAAAGPPNERTRAAATASQAFGQTDARAAVALLATIHAYVVQATAARDMLEFDGAIALFKMNRTPDGIASMRSHTFHTLQ